MAGIKFIETPRGWIKHIVTPAGKVTAELKWNPGFISILEDNHLNAHGYLQKEVLRTSSKYAPMVTSMLIKSGELGTVKGTGEVAWIAPYAWRQYHLVKRKTSQNQNPFFKPTYPYWFDRAWKIYGGIISRDVARMVGKGL